MEAKPICVIYLPKDFVIDGSGRKASAMLLMEALNGNFGETNDNKVKYSDYWQQYYWFCFYDYEVETPQFKVFYEKDFTHVKYEELKNIIEESIKNFKTTDHE